MKADKFADVELVRLRNLKKPTNQLDLIAEPVIIRKKSVNFQYRLLFEGLVNMLLPSYFVLVPEEVVRLRYLSEDRPQLILAGETLSEDIGLSLIERGGRDLSQTLENMQRAVQMTTPESVLYEQGGITLAKLEGQWFEYKSFAIDDEVYNLLFLIASDKHLLLGAFHCQMPYYSEWKTCFLRALEYSEILDVGKQ